MYIVCSFQRTPFDPDYNGNCGCFLNEELVYQCASSQCDTSFHKKRNVLGIFTFVFVSIASLILTSEEHKYVLASHKRGLAQNTQRKKKVNQLHLRKLTSAWKSIIRTYDSIICFLFF